MAFRMLCKTRYLGERESTPFMLDGKEVLVLWPDGGQPRAFEGICPHELQSLVNNSDFNGRILICTVHGWVFNGRNGNGNGNGNGLRPEGCQIREYPMRQGDRVYEVDLQG